MSPLEASAGQSGALEAWPRASLDGLGSPGASPGSLLILALLCSKMSTEGARFVLGIGPFPEVFRAYSFPCLGSTPAGAQGLRL